MFFNDMHCLYQLTKVSDCGKVANDVEMEQVVHAHGVGEGLFSSFLQVRGSIPTFWTQETSVTMPKPPIVLNRIDPT
jgi:phosphatidylinositol 3,5-bisphosphate 5-phosphatase